MTRRTHEAKDSFFPSIPPQPPPEFHRPPIGGPPRRYLVWLGYHRLEGSPSGRHPSVAPDRSVRWTKSTSSSFALPRRQDFDLVPNSSAL